MTLRLRLGVQGRGVGVTAPVVTIKKASKVVGAAGAEVQYTAARSRAVALSLCALAAARGATRRCALRCALTLQRSASRAARLPPGPHLHPSPCPAPQRGPAPSMGAYTNSRDAYASKTFSGQLITTMIINFLINFLWQWGSMGKFASFSSAWLEARGRRAGRSSLDCRLAHTSPLPLSAPTTRVPPPQPLPPGRASLPSRSTRPSTRAWPWT